MAGCTTESTSVLPSFGNRQLWQIISGTGFLRPQEYVEHELEKNKDKLLQGFLFYKKQRIPSGEALLKGRKLKKKQYDFVVRLSQLLGLDELQSHDLFCAYLFTEFRGSRKELVHIMGHERYSQTLLLKIVDFYNGERLYLLRCLRTMLQCWLEGEHPYKELFAKFLNHLLEKNLLKQKLLDQFDDVYSTALPTKDTHGPLLNQAQIMGWALQNLKEQVELLELLVIYYKSFEMDLSTLLELSSRFKKHNFGWGQSYKHLVDGQMEKLIKKIGYLEVLILLEGMDILNAVVSKDNMSLVDHVILCNEETVAKVDEVFSQMRSESVHGPLLLGWSIMLYIYGEVQQAKGDRGDAHLSSKTLGQAHRLGNIALQLSAYNFLLELLDSPHFSGKSEEASSAHYVVFAVVSALLTIYHEESLGNMETLYKIAGKLMKWDFIADTLWEKGEPEGLTTLYNLAKKSFPLDFECFIQLNISLASSGHFSAQKVKSNLHIMHTYTEAMDNNQAQDLQHSGEQGVFILRRNKYPFQSGDFVIKQNCRGTVVTSSAGRCSFSGVNQMMRWDTTYNGWQYLMSEILTLLNQVSQGAGMVQTEQLIKVTMIMELVKEILKSDPSAVPEFVELLSLGYQLILRFGVLNPAPSELLAHTIQCLVLAVPQLHSQVSHHLKQTGLLPFLTENIDSLSKIQSGEGVSQGLYGCVLAGTECAQGVYLVTLAVLDLITQLVQASSKHGGEREHIASVLFVMKEVFPLFHKWKYVNISQRKSIGQKCLQLFHNILNFAYMQEKHITNAQKGPGLQESCVFSLLFTEAGRSLLEIVGTGVDSIQMALAQQSSLMEGVGVDLLELVEMSLSLLNRLLLLKPPDLGPSPVEQALSSQPPGRQHQHLVATIAQYVYHRHSHRLPTLATVLLKRLAMVSPMSILACLGNDAEPIRDLFLTRLQAVSEDVHLRVGILEMLSACVDSQPGLIEIFLNVQQPGDKGSAEHGLKLGRSSCLPILLDLIEVDKQCTYECPPELLCAALDLVHALWCGMREIPMAVLREKQSFWSSVLAPLKVDLPQVLEDDEISVQPLKLQIKLCSFSLRIVAMEIYAMGSVKFDANFKKTLQETFVNDRLMYWSKTVRENNEKLCDSSKTVLLTQDQASTEHLALDLLLAWKNIMITSSRYKVAEMRLTNLNNAQILHDLLVGIQAQFEASDLTQVHVKLASIASALYFTLIKTWGKEFLDKHLMEYTASPKKEFSIRRMVQNLVQTIQNSARSEMLLPSVHIGLLAAVITILQQCGSRLDDLPSLISDLLPMVCSVFLQSSLYLPTFLNRDDQVKDGSPDNGTPQRHGSFGAHLKLQIVSCCLMLELLHSSKDQTTSLKVLQEHGILSCILSTIEALFKARQGIPYIYTSLLLLTKIADTEMGANMLLNSNLTSHLCLALTSCYSSEDAFQPKSFLSKSSIPTFSGLRSVTHSWHTLYCLSLNLFSSMLRVLGHSFLDDALNVVGVHQDRLQQALEMARVVTSKPALLEAEATCNFMLQLCAYHRQWRFHLPSVLAKLMGSLVAMIQNYVALLIRPQYLLHLLEHHKGQDSWGRSDSSILVPSVIQHQSSLDDVDKPTRKLVDAQNSILKLVGKGLVCIKHFTPPLPEILLDQNTDVIEWQSVVTLGFSTPSLDDNDETVSFGTLLNCVTVCVRLLAKNEGKFSPHKVSPDDSNKNQVSRPVVNLTLELCLEVIMSQACRYLRDPALMPRDRQFLKRELGTELTSCLSPLQRQLRRGGVDRSLSLTPPQQTPPAAAGVLTTSTATTSIFGTPHTTTTIPSGSGGHPSATPQLSHSISQISVGNHDPAFLRLVQEFVQKVLK